MNHTWQALAQTTNCEIGHRLKLPPSISACKKLLNEKLCVACSGGVDSLCLTLALAAQFPAHRLAILHYNHATRGQETDDDEHFVAHLACDLGIDFFTEKYSNGSISEGALRRARYAFFLQTMTRLKSRFLLLAHHADDVIETMLMRLARGSTEIAAPKYCQPFAEGTYLLRPLISISKQEIIDLFTKNQIPWREDSSNSKDDYLRNRIRKFLLPMDAIFSGRNWKRGFLLAHRYLEEDATCLNQMAEILCTDPQKLDLQNVPHASIIRRAIQFWLRDYAPSRACFEQIFDAVVQNYFAKISIAPQIAVEIDQKILSKKTEHSDIFEFNFKNWHFGTLYLPTRYKLTREMAPFQNSLPTELNTFVVYVDEKKCDEISIRTWRHGDRYRPINAPTKSLKKLFSEKKIPVRQRSELPVLCDKWGAIFWVPHLPPADFVKVRNNYALKITFSPT
ncbi:MAG: tRNA lysidine(34) synthetase TilS [Puniceicoccales bacterium]|jgi:tRNA(Ile)-lysidine synthase|nr:tRNA lysidine(34) synthetase TilS [Puniceicoccales bacterium]